MARRELARRFFVCAAVASAGASSVWAAFFLRSHLSIWRWILAGTFFLLVCVCLAALPTVRGRGRSALLGLGGLLLAVAWVLLVLVAEAVAFHQRLRREEILAGFLFALPLLLFWIGTCFEAVPAPSPPASGSSPPESGRTGTQAARND